MGYCPILLPHKNGKAVENRRENSQTEHRPRYVVLGGPPPFEAQGRQKAGPTNSKAREGIAGHPSKTQENPRPRFKNRTWAPKAVLRPAARTTHGGTRMRG